MKRIIKAVGYSLGGLLITWKDEPSFRQLTLLALVGLSFIFILPIALEMKILLFLVHGLTLVVELLNSAIEAAIDRISSEIHPLSKKAKDCGSAAQAVILLLLSSIWTIAVYQLIKSS